MGTTLTGTTPQDTYDSLIKVTDNGPLSGTAKYLSDGLGNDSALALSTAGVGVGTTTISSVGSTKVLEVGTTASGGTLTLGGSTAFRISGSTSGVDMYYAASAPINIYTAGTERMRIDASGNVGIGTSSPAAKLHVAGENIIVDRTGGDPFVEFYTGGTTNNVALYGGASTGLRAFVGGAERIRVTTNGLTFNGDTAAANALDDYEEGTWTPTVVANTGSGSPTYSTQLGTYTKIGRQVTVVLTLIFQKNTMSGGYVIVSGLPFTPAANLYSQGAVLIDNLATALSNPILQVQEGQTFLVMLQDNGATGSHAGMSVDTYLGAGSMTLRASATYFV